MTIQTIPFDPFPPTKLSYIIDKCCEHQPWFHDFLWEPYETRRRAATGYLSDAFRSGKVWEVWRESELCGILLINEVVPHIGAKCHFIFFDHELRDKRQICLAGMQQLFGDKELDLHILRVELPTFVGRLTSFLRKALGFSFENEDISSTISAAKRTSRKRNAILWKGKWHSVYLLSVTKDEFAAFLAAKSIDNERSISKEGRGIDSPDSGTTRPPDATPQTVCDPD